MPTQLEFEKHIRDDLRNTLWAVFNQRKVLTISTNWQVLDKTYGEVGGRFLEDFLLSELGSNLDAVPQHHIVNADAPSGRRTMEDIIAEWEIPNMPRQKLLISLKGHKAGSASNPNLVSLQKAKSFYQNHPENVHFLLVVLHYVPERIVKDGFHMQIQTVGIYHLKDLQEHHLSLQTIGAGGQFLLSGIDNIQETYRTPQEFYEILCQKEAVWIEKKRTKSQNTPKPTP